jgi:hypothetical protein
MVFSKNGDITIWDYHMLVIAVGPRGGEIGRKTESRAFKLINIGWQRAEATRSAN